MQHYPTLSKCWSQLDIINSGSICGISNGSLLYASGFQAMNGPVGHMKDKLAQWVLHVIVFILYRPTQKIKTYTLIRSLCLQAERSSCDVLSIPVPIRRGGSESNLDVVDGVGHDGVGLDFTKGALGIDSLQQKILKVRRKTSHTCFSVCL